MSGMHSIVYRFSLLLYWADLVHFCAGTRRRLHIDDLSFDFHNYPRLCTSGLSDSHRFFVCSSTRMLIQNRFVEQGTTQSSSRTHLRPESVLSSPFMVRTFPLFCPPSLPELPENGIEGYFLFFFFHRSTLGVRNSEGHRRVASASASRSSLC